MRWPTPAGRGSAPREHPGSSRTGPQTAGDHCGTAWMSGVVETIRDNKGNLGDAAEYRDIALGGSRLPPDLRGIPDEIDGWIRANDEHSAQAGWPPGSSPPAVRFRWTSTSRTTWPASACARHAPSPARGPARPDDRLWKSAALEWRVVTQDLGDHQLVARVLQGEVCRPRARACTRLPELDGTGPWLPPSTSFRRVAAGWRTASCGWRRRRSGERSRSGPGRYFSKFAWAKVPSARPITSA
jgi:hypothetical protein